MNDSEQYDNRISQQTPEENEVGGIPTLIPLQVSQINFYDDTLLVVLVEVNRERLVMVPLRQFCEYLGVDWSGQYQRVKRDKILASEMMSVVIPQTQIHQRGYYSRPVLCLPLDLLPGWLFTLSPTRVKPEHRERVERYRGKCYRALWKAFLQGELFTEEMGETNTVESILVSPTLSGHTQIDALTEQINTLTAIVSFLHEHRRALLEDAGQVVSIVEAGQQELLQKADQLSSQLTYVSSLLEQLVGHQAGMETQIARIDARTQRLTPAHARAVQSLVERIIRESERRNPKGGALIHAQIYGRLKTHFRAGKFDEIPDERYSEVEEFLQGILRRVVGGEELKQESLF